MAVGFDTLWRMLASGAQVLHSSVRSNPFSSAKRTMSRRLSRLSLDSGGLEAPSWIVSDGTLHLLAFKVSPFLSAADRIFLIDDPERALPASGMPAFHEAFSATRSQLLASTSSPELLDLFGPKEVLSLARREDGVIGVASSGAADDSGADDDTCDPSGPEPQNPVSPGR